MKYLNATTFQRFLAYLIDYIILQIVASFIISRIPAYDTNYKVILDFFKDYVSGVVYDMDGYAAVLKSCALVFVINYGILAILILLYMVLLPTFWEKQTLGRAALGVKVVRKNPEDKMSFGYFCLRELVGGLILTNMLGSGFIILIINVIFCSSYGRSIGDYASSTRLINAKFVPKEPEEPKEESENNDYIDAEIKIIRPKEEETDEDTEYKVF